MVRGGEHDQASSSTRQTMPERFEKREARLTRRAARRTRDPARRDELLAQVTSIPELFELILLQVDMRSLLISAQRVSRAWHGFINASPTMQRALFYAPSQPGRPAHRLQHKHHGGKQRKPEHWLDCGTLRNPFAARILPGWPGLQDGPGSLGSCYLGLHMFDCPDMIFERPKGTSAAAAFMCPGASWRRMLVQQNPPVRLVGMCCYESDRLERSITLTTKLYGVDAALAARPASPKDQAGGGGLTLGEQFDMCKRLRATCRGYSIMVRGRWRYEELLGRHAGWSYTLGEFIYDSDDNAVGDTGSQDGSGGGLVPEFDRLRRELVGAADIVFEVSYGGSQHRPAHYNVCLFSPGEADTGRGHAADEEETEQREPGLLLFRRHRHSHPPVAP